MSLDLEKIRKDFPQFTQTVYDKPLVYLDNAATTLKPKQVVEALQHHYLMETSNIHRGIHYFSELGTDRYEQTRLTIQKLLNAKKDYEIIFTRGTTESINVIAFSFCEAFVKEGDEILISHLEHHSNIVPWQLAAQRKNAKLVVAPINERGEIILEEMEKLITEKTRIVSVSHISNTLGTINPIEEIIKMAHAKGAKVCIDAAQSVAHEPLDVQKLDCDFLVFSGHKIFGPTGIGALYGKEELLNEMPPYQGGGDMIERVSFEKTTYNDLPHKFEAGTPHIAGVIGLKYALDYVMNLGFDAIRKHEHELLDYATEKMKEIDGVRIIGTARNKSSVISFVMAGAHPQDIGTLLDRQGIAIRTGHHCTQPVMNYFCIPGTARASFCFYNTKEEVDRFISGVKKVKEFL